MKEVLVTLGRRISQLQAFQQAQDQVLWWRNENFMNGKEWRIKPRPKERKKKWTCDNSKSTTYKSLARFRPLDQIG